MVDRSYTAKLPFKRGIKICAAVTGFDSPNLDAANLAFLDGFINGIADAYLVIIDSKRMKKAKSYPYRVQ